MFNFTPDQQLALDFPGNVIVSAGAGSGKTRVLVEKYFHLLVDEHPDWPVESVVAITFTRKAASELKSRIIKRVMDELQLDTNSDARRARLLQVRADVGAAPIGTIHTFCGRILKEFAFDAHLNPDFAIVEGARESTLRMDAARQTMAEATADAGGALYQALLAMLNVMSPMALQNLLSGMLGNRTTYSSPSRCYVANSPEELYRDLHLLHHQYATTVRRELSAEWLPIIRELAARCAPGTVQALASIALEAWPADPAAEWDRCAELIENLVQGALTKAGTCRKTEFKKAALADHDDLPNRLEQAAKRYQKTCVSDLTGEDFQDIILTRHLAGLFLRAEDIYSQLRGSSASDEEENEVQLLDYADLEILAEKMLTDNPRLARALRERYRFLIIDEFQDTSEQQWNILRALAIDESGVALPSRLFVVGDRKQGVYGFRDANVRLFSRVHTLITETNIQWENQRGAVTMAANFRTSERPLTLINRVFERVLKAVDSEWSVEFEALTLTRKDDGGCVEYLFVEPEEDADGKPVRTTVDDRRAEEANLVAAHIARAIKNGKSPGDIAILTRKRSAFTPYEEALQQRGIPVVAQQGLNMFHQPELADAIAALNAVVYPHRDLVLVHYFRSPAIGFTDDLLLKISRTPGRSFYDKANRVAAGGKYRLDELWFDLTSDESERLNTALDILRRARELVGTAPPYTIVKQLLDNLGMRLISRATWRGDQALANLDKLLDVARSAEFLSYEDFLDYIESEEQNERGTGEAAELISADAVKIMTIHAAKGLEFPVVYLPDLNSGVSGRSGTVDADGAKWMTLRLSTEMRGETPVFLSEFFKARSEQQGLAEERRVFYVAMTRCRTHLVLCASGGKSAGKNSFFEMIEPEFEAAKEAGELLTPADFSDDELCPPDYLAPSQHTFTGSRQSRIETALRAATILEEKVQPR